MRRVFSMLTFIIIILPVIGVDGFALGQKLPVIDGKATVALVNNEPITLESLKRAVAESSAEIPDKEALNSKDYSAFVKRLVNTRLIVLEAKNIGLDQLPEIQKALDGFAKQTLMEMLIDQQLKGVKAEELAEKGLPLNPQAVCQQVGIREQYGCGSPTPGSGGP